MKIDDNYKYIDSVLFVFEWEIVDAFNGPRIFRAEGGFRPHDGGDANKPDTMGECTFRLLHIEGVASNLERACKDDFINDWLWYAKKLVKNEYGSENIEFGDFYEHIENLLTYYRAASEDAGFCDLVDFILSGRYFADRGKKITKKMICDYLDAVADLPASKKQRKKEEDELDRVGDDLPYGEYHKRLREILDRYANPFPFIAKQRDEITIGLLIGAVENFLVRNGFRERGK